MTTENTNKQVSVNGADFALRTSKLLKKLITCMTQETLAIQSYNRSVAEEMNQEKTLLMHNYQSVRSELEANPEIFKNLDADLKKHLQEITTEFEAVLKDNMMAITTGKKAVSRLITRILDKVRKTTINAPKSYNANGVVVDSASQSTMVPTKLNETY